MEREKESEKVMVYCALNDTVKLLHRALNICEEQKNMNKNQLIKISSKLKTERRKTKR